MLTTVFVILVLVCQVLCVSVFVCYIVCAWCSQSVNVWCVLSRRATGIWPLVEYLSHATGGRMCCAVLSVVCKALGDALKQRSR